MTISVIVNGAMSEILIRESDTAIAMQDVKIAEYMIGSPEPLFRNS